MFPPIATGRDGDVGAPAPPRAGLASSLAPLHSALPELPDPEPALVICSPEFLGVHRVGQVGARAPSPGLKERSQGRSGWSLQPGGTDQSSHLVVSSSSCATVHHAPICVPHSGYPPAGKNPIGRA